MNEKAQCQGFTKTLGKKLKSPPIAMLLLKNYSVPDDIDRVGLENISRKPSGRGSFEKAGIGRKHVVGIGQAQRSIFRS